MIAQTRTFGAKTFRSNNFSYTNTNTMTINKTETSLLIRVSKYSTTKNQQHISIDKSK